MDDVSALALTSMQLDQQRLERIAMNLANVSTPGYKRQVAETRPFSEALEGAAAARSQADGGASLPSSSTLPHLDIRFDSKPGSLRTTGEPLDVALTGDAFLEVMTEQGPAYTRQGNLRLDGRSRLVTAEGLPVMGKNGEIFLTSAAPVIDAAGNITEPQAASSLASGPVAQIKLVRFDHPESLPRLGHGLVAPGEGMAVVNETQPQLHQGALENANVAPLREMVRMMEILRHFESMQKATQSYDEMVGSAIRKLGELG